MSAPQHPSVLQDRVLLAQQASPPALHLTPSLCEKEIVHSQEYTSFPEKDVALNSHREEEEDV